MVDCKKWTPKNLEYPYLYGSERYTHPFKSLIIIMANNDKTDFCKPARKRS